MNNLRRQEASTHSHLHSRVQCVEETGLLINTLLEVETRRNQPRIPDTLD